MRQQRKHVRLQRGHQGLQQQNRRDQHGGRRSDQPTAEKQNDAGQRQDRKVAGNHIAEQTNRERERLDQLALDLDRRKYLDASCKLLADATPPCGRDRRHRSSALDQNVSYGTNCGNEPG